MLSIKLVSDGKSWILTLMMTRRENFMSIEDNCNDDASALLSNLLITQNILYLSVKIYSSYSHSYKS